MKKKKIRKKTPAYNELCKGVKEQGSDYFWQFTDAQLEKIDRKIAKIYEARQDIFGYVYPHWEQSKGKWLALKNALEIHATQRIFFGEQHKVEWESDDIGRIL